ncbi:MAG: hypothetical protein H6713_31245 [Myxococcales bacterium]|nr:hypothetical protein [Myxococcales bacterium]MCB9754437.1 hypothetical protein [Myxococcales bacterium]
MDIEREDFNKPIRVAENTWWVGKRDPNGVFHANPYLRVFSRQPGDKHERYSVLVDPGSSSDFAVVSSKVNSLIGSLSRLSMVFINHQDPDVGSSAAVIAGRYAPKVAIMCSEETWRLIVHFNLPKNRFFSANKATRGVRFKTGHTLLPVPSPFCHFRGATMLYDPQTRVLFSGDLFGGLSPRGVTSLWATEEDWSGMRAFHQLYMPSNKALQMAIETIRALDPPVETIAPQHGRVIRGPLVEEFMQRIAALPVGLDLLVEAEDESTLVGWNSVLARVVELAEMYFGASYKDMLRRERALGDTLSMAGDRPQIIAQGRWTIERLVHALCAGQNADIASTIKMEAIFAADELHLPAPRIELHDSEDSEVDDDFAGLID